MIPENDENIYTCNEQHPVHLSALIDKFRYRPYGTRWGGAVAITKSQFEKSKGYSNLYFGWGDEDLDMENRIKFQGMTVLQPNPTVQTWPSPNVNGS